MTPEEQARAPYAAIPETSTEGARWYIWKAGHGINYVGGKIASEKDAKAIAVELNALALSREEQVRAEEGWHPIAGMASAMAEAEAVIVGWWFVHPRLGTSWETDTDPFNPNATHFALLPAPPSLRASGHEGGERDG